MHVIELDTSHHTLFATIFKGFDDFSGGLTMPKYNVDSAEQIGLSDPGSKANPAKAAKMEKMQEVAGAKKEAAAAKVSSQVYYQDMCRYN